MAFLPGSNSSDTLHGTEFDDTLTGYLATNLSDTDFSPASDNDTINGFGGSDLILGGHGDDALYGGRGDDSLFAAAIITPQARP